MYGQASAISPDKGSRSRRKSGKDSKNSSRGSTTPSIVDSQQGYHPFFQLYANSQQQQPQQQHMPPGSVSSSLSNSRQPVAHGGTGYIADGYRHEPHPPPEEAYLHAPAHTGGNHRKNGHHHEQAHQRSRKSTSPHPLTQKHLVQHQMIMQEQWLRDQQEQLKMMQSPKPKKTKPKQDKSPSGGGFWSKSKRRSLSENRDKKIAVDNVYGTSKRSNSDRSESKKSTVIDVTQSNKKKDEQKRRSVAESPPKEKQESAFNRLFWGKSKRRSLSELPQAALKDNKEAKVTAKQKRHSVAEYPTSESSALKPGKSDGKHMNAPSGKWQQPVDYVEPMQVNIKIEADGNNKDAVDYKDVQFEEDDKHTEDTKEQSNEKGTIIAAKRANRRSKSTESFRTKSTDSGFFSSRSKSPDSMKPNRSKSVEQQLYENTLQNRIKSSDSLKSKISAIKSSDSLNTMVENVLICNSLVELCKVTPTPTSPTPSDLNNNGDQDRRSRSTTKAPEGRADRIASPSPAKHTPRHPNTNTNTHSTPAKNTAPDSPGSSGPGVHRQRSFKSLGRRQRDESKNSRYPADVYLSKNIDYRDFESDLGTGGDGGPGNKMLAKATRIIQDHVKPVKEVVVTTPEKGGHHHHHHHHHHKTGNNKHSSGGKMPMKEINHGQVIPNYHTNDPVHYVVDKKLGVTYLKGRLLGKGGFAKCYEMTDIKTNKVYAGKIISKNRISKPHQREKIAREIELHRNLRHRHIVQFINYFEDDDSVYIILENCSKKSLVHVLKNRKTLTEPEVRFYMRHLVYGCKYCHSERIIHRDLKLGNMLLNEGMNVKIADFGLATRVEYEGEKKMTVCGTPNYIAPEVLQKKGHSYEADIWAMGCIMYAMLVGRPPFETSTLKETYMRITANKYFIPPHVSKSARHLIQKLLHPDPSSRPSLDKILADDFFSAGYNPKSLPTSCCDSPPKFPSSSHTPQRPKSYAAPVSPADAMQKITSSLAQLKGSRKSASQILTRNKEGTDENAQTGNQPMVHIPGGDSNSALNNGFSSGSKDNMLGSEPKLHNSRGDGLNQIDTQSQQPPPPTQHFGSNPNLLNPLNGAINSQQQPQQQQPPHLQYQPQQQYIQQQQQQHYAAQQQQQQAQQQHNNDKNECPAPAVAPAAQRTGHVNQTGGGSLVSVATAPGSLAGVAVVGGSGELRPMSPVPMQTQPPANNGSQQQLHRQNSNGDNNAKGFSQGSAIRLYQMLTSLLEQLPPDSNPSPIQNAKPLWVTKWVDYSNKYGFGFQLSDKSCGVLFNDTTRMLLAPDGKTVQYNDLSNRVYTFTTDTTPADYQKKSTLMLYFAQYMDEHLIHGGDVLQKENKSIATGIFMKKWFRTSKAIVMYLNNGTLQVNFFEDHTKVIISADGQDYLVTYINASRVAQSFRLLQFRHFGCHPDIARRLGYSRRMLESIINIEGEAV